MGNGCRYVCTPWYFTLWMPRFSRAPCRLAFGFAFVACAGMLSQLKRHVHLI